MQPRKRDAIFQFSRIISARIFLEVVFGTHAAIREESAKILTIPLQSFHPFHHYILYRRYYTLRLMTWHETSLTYMAIKQKGQFLFYGFLKYQVHLSATLLNKDQGQPLIKQSTAKNI